MQPQASKDVEVEVMPDAPITAVGPGARAQQGPDVPSMLDNVTDYDFVEVFNPLSVTFIAQVASTIPKPAKARIVNTSGNPDFDERDLSRAGLGNMRTQSPTGSVVHVPHQVPLPAGSTTPLRGSEAKVVVRQLVTEILGREGKTNLLANSFQRSIAEKKVVRRIGQIDLSQIMGVDDQIKRQMGNMEVTEPSYEPQEQTVAPTEELSPEFAGAVAQPTQQSLSESVEQPTADRRSPGRPRKQAA